MSPLPRGAIILPRLRDRRRGRWPPSRCLALCGRAAVRRLEAAVRLAELAPTDLHARQYIARAGEEAERAYRIARRVATLRAQGR